jgi:hypothetical protein
MTLRHELDIPKGHEVKKFQPPCTKYYAVNDIQFDPLRYVYRAHLNLFVIDFHTGKHLPLLVPIVDCVCGVCRMTMRMMRRRIPII